jgi:methylglutaconyl-CoA hydratase
MISEGFVDVAIEQNGLAKITFGHPSHNAMPSSLLKQLKMAIDNTGALQSVRMILLQSAGDRTFCAGANFDELLLIEDVDTGKNFFSGFAGVINAIRTSPKLVIGRIQGKAVGGGVGLAAACDYAFATQYAGIRLSELSIHIGPFVIAPALLRKMGVAAFTQLTLHPGTVFDAAWAHQHLLFQEVSESISAMDEAIAIFTEHLLDKNPSALEALKRTLWMGTEHWGHLLEEQAGISGKLVIEPSTKALLKKLKHQTS